VNADLIEPLRKRGPPAGNVHPFQVDDSRPDCGIEAYRDVRERSAAVCTRSC
jgi:hypothetical protein